MALLRSGIRSSVFTLAFIVGAFYVDRVVGIFGDTVFENYNQGVSIITVATQSSVALHNHQHWNL